VIASKFILWKYIVVWRWELPKNYNSVEPFPVSNEQCAIVWCHSRIPWREKLRASLCNESECEKVVEWETADYLKSGVELWMWELYLTRRDQRVKTIGWAVEWRMKGKMNRAKPLLVERRERSKLEILWNSLVLLTSSLSLLMCWHSQTLHLRARLVVINTWPYKGTLPGLARELDPCVKTN
jgi:hypothetical protein